MAQKFPEDEFDRLAAERMTVGAHRRPSNARSWIYALLAVLILAPIVGILIGNSMSKDDAPTAEQTTATAPADETTTVDEATDGGGMDNTEPAEDGATDSAEDPAASTDESAEQTDDPVAEPDMNHQVMVLNGRGVAGFAGENQAILEQAGFTNTAVADYRGGAEPAESTIYFSSLEYEGTAQAAAEALGVTNIVLDAEISGAYGMPIVAVMR